MRRKVRRILMASSILLTVILVIAFPFALRTNLGIHINIAEVSWPPLEPSISEYGTSFGILMQCEVWNPNNHVVTIFTGNMNLLSPQLTIEWDYPYEYSAGTIFLPATNTYYIQPGLSTFYSSTFLYIYNYNNTTPPNATYVLWNEIDGNSAEEMLTHYGLRVKSYKTRIQQEGEWYEINKPIIPLNWGDVTIFPIDWVVIILLILSFVGVVMISVLTAEAIIKQRKNKSEEKKEDYLA
ncbi:MAG: hypothetical protein ACTSUP_00550 [Candidatus Heimdallarchaeaceae archaeon]